MAFAFSDAPQAYQSETSFASYQLNVEHREGKILVSRQLESRHEIIAPERYAEVVEFYENASRADSSPVILDIR